MEHNHFYKESFGFYFMRDWLEYRQGLEAFLRSSKDFSIREKNEILIKKFGVLGDCSFLIYVDNYSVFLG